MTDMLFTKGFADAALRGRDIDQRPWDLSRIIKKDSNTDFDLLDIGCGASHKLLELSPFFRKIIGIDPSEAMREISLESIENAKIKNMIIMDGSSQHIPLRDESVDIVTCMLAPFDIHEAHRVLKKGGFLIREAIGDKDKINMKKLFGRDNNGWRGQYMNAEKPLDEIYKNDLKNLFTDILIENGFWNTILTMEGLLMLLEQTPSIRNFDKIKDAAVLKAIETTFVKNGEMTVTQNRLLIRARKI